MMIEKIFYHSDKDAAGYANARTITGTRSVTQIAIMEQLANNLQGELMEMAGTAKRSVENVFTIARLENDPYRKLALEQILRQEAAGKPWIKSSQDLVKEMGDKRNHRLYGQGRTGKVYAGLRKHGGPDNGQAGGSGSTPDIRRV